MCNPEGDKSIKKKFLPYYYLVLFQILDIFTDLSFEIFVIIYLNQILQILPSEIRPKHEEFDY